MAQTVMISVFAPALDFDKSIKIMNIISKYYTSKYALAFVICKVTTTACVFLG